MKKAIQKANEAATNITKAQAKKLVSETSLGKAFAQSVTAAIKACSTLEKAEVELAHQDGLVETATDAMITSIGEVQAEYGEGRAHEFIRLVYRSNGWEVRNYYKGTPAPKRIQETISRIRSALNQAVSINEAKTVYGIRKAVEQAKAAKASTKVKAPKAPDNVVVVRGEAETRKAELDDKIVDLETVRASKKGEAQVRVAAQIEAVNVQHHAAEYEALLADLLPDQRDEAHAGAVTLLKSFLKSAKGKAKGKAKAS
jgi:ribosomal protein S24E